MYIYAVDEHFFDRWTSQMAYLLGFTYADGCIYKTTLSWDIQLADRGILEKFKLALRATYPITVQRQRSCRLRISNQKLLLGAKNRGLVPKKNVRTQIPQIPKELLRHFIRGYLDGDGWITLRKTRTDFSLGFSNGNRDFLVLIARVISQYLSQPIRPVRLRTKITPKGFHARSYMLEFYSSSAFKVASWLWDDLAQNDLFLDRKRGVYERAKTLYSFLNSGTKKVRVIQRDFNQPLQQILNQLHTVQGLDGVKIAKLLGVHPSSAYRWLEQTGLHIPSHRKIYG